ncbi:response regulator transcription factor [Shimia ponticola]|uniref:response regulator transcription factor n=1 Tax=Shimia ponticola TaxID=2582893 RepID=UPI0011BF491E|nr:response regulator transcription factor [Shimia ponticola]
MQVLVVEDEAETREFLTRGLSEAGWDVTVHDNPQPALLDLGARRFDVIILDRMMPGMDGLSALKLMRGAGVTTPVILLTAMSGIDDRVEGLESGADDYLVKPFALSELIARIKSIARRPEIVEEVNERRLGSLHIDRLARQARRGDVVLDLSPIEYKLLDVIVEHAGEVVTRSMLLEKVWGYRFDPKTSLVQTHMSRLRAKLDKPFDTEMIRTVHGSGYMIHDPD